MEETLQKPKRKKSGGRKKGTPNKATADVRALAQNYGEEAILTLVKVMQNNKNPQAQIAAAKELLNRGYGAPSQVLNISMPKAPLIIQGPSKIDATD